MCQFFVCQLTKVHYGSSMFISPYLQKGEY